MGEHREPGAAPRPKRVLVVDDDGDVRDAIAETLRFEGYDVVEAPDGLRALELLGRGPAPDVIILDLMMPVMDGREFLRRRQSVPELRAIPVIVLTAGPSDGVADLVSAVLSKTMDVDRIVEQVESCS